MGMDTAVWRREQQPSIPEQGQETEPGDGDTRCRWWLMNRSVGLGRDRARLETVWPDEELSSARHRQLSNGMRYTTVSFTIRALQNMMFAILLLEAFVVPTQAAFVNFQNCLSPQIIYSPALQFVPLFVNAVFNATDAAHNLNITVYGNVSITPTSQQQYPPPNSSSWTNNSMTLGKITDLSPTNPVATYSTLFTVFNVLSFMPYKAPRSRFCNSTIPGTQCPISPRFFGNA